MQVLVTGADGFIGRPLCAALVARGHAVRKLVRRAADTEVSTVAQDLLAPGDWRPIVAGIDVIVHLAARAHVVRETAPDAEAQFRRMNVEATARLAEVAAAAGVRRFVLISSIGVNGPATFGVPFRETDVPRPAEPYARSKLEAEQALLAIAGRAAMESVIVRPPAVYGPHVKGNLRRMARLAASGVPLPLASIRNKRNLVSTSNLSDALALCVEVSRAAGETFLVAEPEPRSTPEIFRAMAAALGRRDRLFPFPSALLRGAAASLGKVREFDKMCGSLEVDAGKLRSLLGWQPLPTFAEGMAAAARSSCEGAA